MRWIQENNICCLLVDYKLDSEYSFSGTDLVAYINSVLPDLPCIILTAFRGQSIGEHLVIKPMIRDRDIFTDSKEFSAFADELQHAAQVYTKRLELHEAEYAQLLAKKANGQLSVKEEERFLTLYRLLRDYGIVDVLPEQLLRPEIEQKMDAMLDQLRTLVKETSNSEGDD